MKFLSVFSNGHEIEIRNTWLGKENIYYNGQLVSSKYSFWGAAHVFEVQEDREYAEYVIKIGFNMWGWVSANVWRNGEAIVKGLCTSYEQARPNPPTSFGRPNGHYTSDLV